MGSATALQGQVGAASAPVGAGPSLLKPLPHVLWSKRDLHSACAGQEGSSG